MAYAAEIPADLRPSLAGSLFYWFLPVRRSTVLANMRRVFGEGASEKDIRRLARCFYSHLLRSIRENLSLVWTSTRRHTSLVELQGVEHMLKAAERGKGLLVLSGHFGNWEYAAIGAIRQFEEYRGRFHIIRKRLSRGLEGWVVRRCERAGLRVIERRDALVRSSEALEQNDAVVYIMDQHASVGRKRGRNPKSLHVEFFGRKAWTNRSLSLLAANTGAAVVPATSYRRPDGTHVMRFEEPLEWIGAEDTKEELLLNTRRYNEVLERFVLEHPDQWFWMHRRWKERSSL
jgi:KDO2-lipid IV(A) lauroyltransferase